jgi:hypothetical protein
MRKRISVAMVIVAALAGLLGLTGLAPAEPEAKAGHLKIGPCPVRYTAKEFRAFTADVWRLPRWERGKPKDATLAAMRHKRRCAESPSHRAAMRHAWKKAKAAYYQHRTAKLRQRKREREEAKFLSAITPPGPDVLAAIRACESGGDYSIDTGNGFYGAYQFTLSTWASVGGSGNPAQASPAEQDYRAALLYQQQGSSPWPVCGV